ncbi:hypothetical protein AAHC03_026336 [Spirometra sp. Aus1]
MSTAASAKVIRTTKASSHKPMTAGSPDRKGKSRLARLQEVSSTKEKKILKKVSFCLISHCRTTRTRTGRTRGFKSDCVDLEAVEPLARVSSGVVRACVHGSASTARWNTGNSVSRRGPPSRDDDGPAATTSR